MNENEIAIDGPFAEMQMTAEPAMEDWAIKLMNQVAKSELLTKHLLLNDHLFYPVRRAVNLARSIFAKGASFGARP